MLKISNCSRWSQNKNKWSMGVRASVKSWCPKVEMSTPAIRPCADASYLACRRWRKANKTRCAKVSIIKQFITWPVRGTGRQVKPGKHHQTVHYLACRRRRKAGETRCAKVSIIRSSDLASCSNSCADSCRIHHTITSCSNSCADSCSVSDIQNFSLY